MPELFDALQARDATAVRELLAERPAIATERTEDGVSAVLWAMYVGAAELAPEVAAAKGDLDVFEAAGLGLEERLRTLLEADPSLAAAWSGDGWQPLHLAAFFGRPAAAGLLLTAGAALDEPARGPSRVTPLHSAAAGRHADVVRILLEAGADVHVRQQGGWTPLHSAAQNGDLDSVRLLLVAGADPTVGNDEGRTSLDLATTDAVRDALATRAG